MNPLIRLFLGLLAAVGLATASAAEDHGTRDEAKAMAQAAVAYIAKVGPDKAYADFTDDKATWVRKDLYVFVFDMEGVTRAHGTNAKLVGKSLAGLKDQNGKAFIKEMMDVASAKGEGWVDYDWPNPISKKIEPKTSFVERVPGKDLFVGVGAYR